MPIKTQAKEMPEVLIYILGVIILPILFSSECLENNFLQGKGELIYQLGNPTLGALSY